MGAVVRSNMFDDLIEQGVDDDLLTGNYVFRNKVR